MTMSLHKIKYKEFPFKQDRWGIEIDEGQYAGIKFLLGKVSLHEDDAKDNLTLKYNYDIIENPVEFTTQEQIKDFEYFVGTLVTQMLDDGVKKNDLIYTGGVDEN